MAKRPRNQITSAWFLLILANVLFASSYVAAKFILQDLSVIMTLVLRLGIAAVLVSPLLSAKRKEFILILRDMPTLVVLVLSGFVINNLLEYGGLALTTASDVALLITSESIFTAILSWLLLREPVKRMTVIALLLGTLGVYLIVERSLVPNIPSGGGISRILGDLLVVVALLFEAYYSIRGKTLLTKHEPLLVTSASILGSMVFWLPIGGWELLHSGWRPLNLASWLAIGWLAGVSTVLAYFAWFQGLAKIDGSAAASTLFIQPLLGTVLAVVLLHDQLVPATIIGGLLVIMSVYLISRS